MDEIRPQADDLFAEFETPSRAQWRAVVEEDLKGAPFEKKLVARTWEGIPVQPLYLAEDAAELGHLRGVPGVAPYVRGARAEGFLRQPWEVSQEIPYPSPLEFNQAARHDLGRGLTALNLNLDRATRAGLDPDFAVEGDVGAGGVSIATLGDLATALQDIDLSQTSVFVRSGASGLPFMALVVALMRQRGQKIENLRGCIEMDPLGVLSHEGSLPQSLDEAYREMAVLTRWALARAPRLQTVCVHGRPYHESGASAVQELAFCLATGTEYLRAMDDRGLPVGDVAPRMRFAFLLGSDFFMEIAKMRAARLLWHRIVTSFGAPDNAGAMHIHARTCLWNKTRFDAYVNLLRSTTEAFAAVLGGCDSLQIAAFDEVFGLPDEFSRRIARNTQLILQHEAKLTRVIDPAGGSWYVERLTEELASRAWALFQEVERSGGMEVALREGFPRRSIEGVAAERRSALRTRRGVLVGTNQYANVGEAQPTARVPDLADLFVRRRNEVQEYRTGFKDVKDAAVMERLRALLGTTDDALLEVAAAAVESGATLGEITRVIRGEDTARLRIEPLRVHRLAEEFEALREASERFLLQTGMRPRAFLAIMGPVRQHKARADFARGFLEVGGFEIIYPARGFDEVGAACAAAVEARARVVVLCSTDETYPELVPVFCKALEAADPDAMAVLAGFPTDFVESFRQSGIGEFIHLRADLVDINRKLLGFLGVL